MSFEEKYLFWLGNQPALSATEITRCLERDDFSYQIDSLHENRLYLNLSEKLPKGWLSLIGGVERYGLIIDHKSTVWEAIDIVDVLGDLPSKFRLGISGINVFQGYTERLGNEIKRVAGEKGSKVRFVLPKGKKEQLNSAQVIFNRLYENPHKELTVTCEGGEYFLVQTCEVQDIEAYEKRDTLRPARDAKVGLLPPKLAQIMLNCVPNFLAETPMILDPFCGMGTILQEGWLMGYEMRGSDASERMVQSSNENIAWLSDNFEVDASSKPDIIMHDSQEVFDSEYQESFDAVVTEPYLGAPTSTPLTQDQAHERFEKLSVLYTKSFEMFYPILKRQSWIVFALPALKARNGQNGDFMLFPSSIIDELEKYGYSYHHLVPEKLAGLFPQYVTNRGSAIYARPQAYVGRELTLWQRDEN